MTTALLAARSTPDLQALAQQHAIRLHWDYRFVQGKTKHDFSGIHVWATASRTTGPTAHAEVHVRAPVRTQPEAVRYVIADVLEQLGVGESTPG